MSEFSLDALLPLVRDLELEGAVVVVKWDGQRESRRCSVVVTHPATDEYWRAEGDDAGELLAGLIAEYRSRYPALFV